MFTLPEKQMGYVDAIKALFACWLSTLLVTLPLCLLCEFLKVFPALLVSLKWILPYHKGVILSLLIVFTLLSFIPLAALIIKLNKILHGKTLTNKAALQIGFSRLFKLFILGVLFALVMFLLGKFGGLLAPHLGNRITLLIISLILLIAMPFFLPTLPFIIVDNKWPFDAMASSVRFIKGHWLFSFTLMMTSAIASLVLNRLFMWLTHAIDLYSTLWIICNAIFTAVILPLGISSIMLIYENLKLPK